jgi:hypothetical protein
MTDSFPAPLDVLTGQCMCSAVSYTISTKPIAVGLCHCNRCRPQSSSSFSTVVIVHRRGVALTGETAYSRMSVRAA